MRSAIRQKKGQRVFFRPLSPTINICRFIKSDVYKKQCQKASDPSVLYYEKLLQGVVNDENR
ncbi:hypothetical protein [Aneurinibacillus migulanus]|uniref:Uncharacterized protein n=1 Tax=Aneurinibacillus migulanus TaxID=47500 RepID=A0A0D1W8W9_ANEMI|nr:hypothetical protein [Aneurinibacillus migulanus]KIV54985.1 hypothetical protein TS65_17540 [Aneurinibacillus migulanus]KON94439.1 hypothetical protein AF333_01980 [Aneurinibacillus migulanus]